MKRNHPARQLRENPDIDQLKRQAKDLLKAFLAGDSGAVAEVNAHYRRRTPRFALHEAQLVLARSYGFDSWPKLKAYVEGATIKRLAELVRADDLERVRAMLKARPELADMEMSYGDEHRPLHFAVMNRSPEMVRLLLRHGADPHRGIHPHRDATTPMTIAVERGFEEIAAILREEEQRPARTAADPSQVHGSGAQSPAHAAAASGDAEWLRARHADGTLVNPITWDEGGLLTVAVRNNHPDILKLLLEFGFDPDERVRSGDGNAAHYSQGYPLWHAAALGRRDIAEILLDHGASPSVHVDSSGSAVYSAYSHRQWEMAEFLRQRGGVVSADIAAIYRQTDLARQMLADDARPALAQELLDFAASGGDPEIVRMALERIDWPRDDRRWFWFLQRPLDFWNHIPWLYAGNKDLDRGTYFQCFRRILERCDANVIGGFNRTVLHEVGAAGDHITDNELTPFAAALLDAGARPDVRDEILKSTPLGWACRWGRASVVKILLERGADPLEPEGEPWARPCAWARKMHHAGIVELLDEHGG